MECDLITIEYPIDFKIRSRVQNPFYYKIENLKLDYLKIENLKLGV